MRFEWDDHKNASNLKKHGVDFETASLIFDDPLQATIPDREVDGEQRWWTLGMAEGLLLIVVVHTNQEDDEEEVIRIISTRVRMRTRGDDMKTLNRRRPGTPASAEQKKQLGVLAGRTESAIDYTDIPAIPEASWARVERGKFYRPLKQAVSLRLDADVIAWLKKDGDGYQTRANQLLRQVMLRDMEQG